MTPADAMDHVIDQVRAARADARPLCLHGGRTKDFHGEPAQGTPLDMRVLTGISSYEPSELVVTVRAGTPLAELEATLAEQGQCLPFEPPRLGAGGTVGGMVAAGLSGPARATVGCVRDFLLGATVLNGQAQVLSFGGQVMKNVAGYDMARLFAGSLGVLGPICEVSLKVLPLPAATATLRFDMPQDQAIKQINAWASQPLPLNASAWWAGTLVIRLSGAIAAVQSACQRLGGEAIPPDLAAGFWQGLRDQADEFFTTAQAAVNGGATLWRLSVPSTTGVLALPGDTLLEWGGAQRWLVSTDASPAVRDTVVACGGHATVWRGARGAVFTPLSPVLARVHRELKKSFDPDGLFNPGRLYPGL
jgi:glycolate oxidase FAD binding subunit